MVDRGGRRASATDIDMGHGHSCRISRGELPDSRCPCRIEPAARFAGWHRFSEATQVPSVF
jgi:hypothetical protein